MTDKSTRLMRWAIRTLSVLVVLAVVGWLFLASLPPVEPVAMTNESRQEDTLDREQSDNVINTEDELHEGCVVSILNRTAKVREDGSWQINNVPVGLGPVRARFTCIEPDGRTRSGQSDFFVMEANQVTGFNSQLSQVEPIPTSLSISATTTRLTEVGATSQLTVTATYPDSSTGNVSRQSSGTGYTSSNPTVVTVSADGLLTAIASGSVLISVLNEGSLGMMQVQVVLGGDSDGDGIPNDVELANGLDPNDPVDGLEDPDQDLLTNQEELMVHGTQYQNPDSDGDTILDGEEVVAGEDGYITNALLVDSDNDGLRDGLEVATGNDPTDASDPSDYSTVLDSLSITPELFVLTVNSIVGQASQQLSVTGQLVDGSRLDLTSGTLTNTNYSSSDLTVCNFSATPGQIFASTDGLCTITATNSALSAPAIGLVESFTPVALSFLDMPGYANSVDVSGDLAYVAADSSGLQVVDVSDRNAPTIVGAIGTTDAQDVKVVGDLAYVADGSAGLQIIDIMTSTAPVILGSVDTTDARDVVLSGDRAYVADGSAGLRIIDVSNSATPTIVGTVDTLGTAQGVDVSQDNFAVVAIGTSGIQIIDLTNLTIAGSIDTGDARDVVVDGQVAFVADYSSSLTSVNISAPQNPQVLDSTPLATGGRLVDLVVANDFAFGADIFFVNGVPIVYADDPQNLIPRIILDFGNFRDDNGTGIAVDEKFVYLTAAKGSNTRLYIGQYLQLHNANAMLDGEVKDANSELAIEGALVTADDGHETWSATTNVSGDYRIILPVGTYTVTAAASNYLSTTVSNLLVVSNTLTTQDFALAAGLLAYSPSSMEESVTLGHTVSKTLTISNTGSAPFNFELSDANTGSPTLAALSPTAAATRSSGLILLVDDDDNNPNVRSFYTDALDALGVAYDIWDTNNSDNEPDAATLDSYTTVVWFTGDEYGGVAGPGSAGEAALGSFLDDGKCLFISSQDYHWDRTLTPFMSTYLGVGSYTNDRSQTSVTGAGTVFGGVGSYALSYPFTNYSDIISPDESAELAFSGDKGNAAVNKDNSTYRTTFWGFPFEAVADANDRQELMSTVLSWCGALDAEWVIQSPDRGTLMPGQSMQISIIFDSSVVSQSGTYTAQLNFKGNYQNSAAPAILIMNVE